MSQSAMADGPAHGCADGADKLMHVRRLHMKDHLHCYHVNFAQETETCCWCSIIRKLKFGQGQFDLDVGMATPLLSVWWWRYNPKMYAMYQHIKQFGTPKMAHGPYSLDDGLFLEYADEDTCSRRKQLVEGRS
jgi:hypothetical protein